MDVLEIVYNSLLSDETIAAAAAAGKVKYYEFPENTPIRGGRYL